jgi:molecular chaperone GrpE (heat shock protein)
MPDEVREQIARLEEAVHQLDTMVRAQSVQSRASDLAVLQELQKLSTGGAQRAMAGVYNKLLRALLGHMNELDDLVAAAHHEGNGNGKDAAWWNAIAIARDRFEAILRDWGCTPLDVRIGEEEFDPERHEPAAPAGGGTNTIREVRRRGWRSATDVLQLPLVVVD